MKGSSDLKRDFPNKVVLSEKQLSLETKDSDKAPYWKSNCSKLTFIKCSMSLLSVLAKVTTEERNSTISPEKWVDCSVLHWFFYKAGGKAGDFLFGWKSLLQACYLIWTQTWEKPHLL